MSAPMKLKSRHFSFFRITFGAYLFSTFVLEFPERLAFFGNSGVLPPNYLSSILPSWLADFYVRFWSDELVNFIYFGRFFFAAMIIVGFHRRVGAAILFALQLLLLNRNIATVTPEVGYVNWLLLALVFIPEGEGYAFRRPDPKWTDVPSIRMAAWAVLAVSHFYSACMKLEHVRWGNGSAMTDFLNNEMAVRPSLFSVTSAFPLWLGSAVTFAVLFIELSGPFALPFRKTRFLWWLAGALLHLGALVVFPIAEISLGLLLFHYFLFDVDWLT